MAVLVLSVRLPGFYCYHTILARGEGVVGLNVSLDIPGGLDQLGAGRGGPFPCGYWGLESAFVWVLALEVSLLELFGFSSTSLWVFPDRWLSLANPATTGVRKRFHPTRFWEAFIYKLLRRSHFVRYQWCSCSTALSITRRAQSGIHRRVHRFPTPFWTQNRANQSAGV